MRLSGRNRSEAKGGLTASKVDHFTEGGQAGRESKARARPFGLPGQPNKLSISLKELPRAGACARSARVWARAKRARWRAGRRGAPARALCSLALPQFFQRNGQFLRLSGQARSEAEGGPTALEIDHFIEGNATCWSDACENAGSSPAPVHSLRSRRSPPLEASRALP